MTEYYLITKEELLKIGATDATAKEIMAVTIDVIARPYVERSTFSILTDGVKRGGSALANAVDKASKKEPAVKGYDHERKRT
jgi:hypothetical protein